MPKECYKYLRVSLYPLTQAYPYQLTPTSLHTNSRDGKKINQMLLI